MNAYLRRAGIGIGLLGAVAVSTAAVIPTAITPESRIWVEGTSSVRSYRCEAAEVKGNVETIGSALDVAKLDGAVRTAEVFVEVAGLDCGNGTMNGHLRKALKADQHAAVRFHLQDYDVVTAGAETRVRLTGTLEIAGTQKPFTAEGVASGASDGTLRVQGSQTIRMTEFGVKPPSLMMGTMKVHDPVKLNFDVGVEK